MWPITRRPVTASGRTVHPVRALQDLLRARGHVIAVDGIVGPRTDAAVKAFQTAWIGLPAKPSVPRPGRRPVTWQALVSGMLSGYAVSPLSASPHADQNRWNHSPPAALTSPLG